MIMPSDEVHNLQQRQHDIVVSSSSPKSKSTGANTSTMTTATGTIASTPPNKASKTSPRRRLPRIFSRTATSTSRSAGSTPKQTQKQEPEPELEPEQEQPQREQEYTEEIEVTISCEEEDEEDEDEDQAAKKKKMTKKISKIGSIMKYKTQEDSLLKPYPKPYICCSSSSDEKNKKKGVRFAMVTIQSYPTILSDHPNPIMGPAIGLDWDVVETEQMTVAQHFTKNPWRRQKKPHHFHLSKWSRERMLLARGYSLEEIQQAQQEGAKIRRSRQTNALGYPIWLHPILDGMGIANSNVHVDANTKAVRRKKLHEKKQKNKNKKRNNNNNKNDKTCSKKNNKKQPPTTTPASNNNNNNNNNNKC